MTAFVLCLSVAAGAMAWHFGFTRGVRIGRAIGADETWRAATAQLDAAFPGAAAQRKYDRAAIDALVGPSTYEGGGE